MTRLLFVSAIAALSLRAAAAPPDGGFHLEPRAVVDDVFGDAGDYRRIVDKFLQLTESMQGQRDDFARAVQAILATLATVDKARPRKCPEAGAAAPYARALTIGQDYLRAGRELGRYYDQVREYDRLGETVGLTPDYRWKVKKVVQQYNALLTDYREMKVAFHDQLADELRFAGCDLDKLATRGGYGQPKEEWPAPGDPGAPGVAAVDKSPIPQPPPSQPPRARPEPVPIEIGPPSRAGVLFYVDNTRCQTGTHVSLDGRLVGDVPAATRAGFPTTPGPHELCLISDGAAKKFGDPGTVRKSYLHEGWTIALRCD